MPSTLALAGRYGKRIAVRGAMMSPQYRYASAAIRYGPTAARAAGRIGRWAYKRWRKRRRSGYRASKKARYGIGERIGASNSKQTLQTRDNAFIAIPSRTLNITQLTGTDQGTSNNRQDRQNTIINCRGFKICMAVRNNIQNQPLYYNCAILSPKNAGDITTANFFRGTGTLSRGLDFDNDRTALELHCLPINTDKFYVLKHKRYRLGPENRNNQQYHDAKMSNFMNIDWYVRLKRQLRYDDPDSNFPIDGAVYLVQWCDSYEATAGSLPLPTPLQVMQRHIMYFRDSKT